MSGKEIDTKALMEEGKDFKSRDIKFFKQPDKENNFYGYRVKFIQEPRDFTSKAGNKYDCADGLLVEVVNDEDVKAGTEYTFVLPYVLKKKMLEKGQGSITNKTFDVAGRGKRTPKKKGAREYYDFGVMIQEGTLSWSMLKRVLPFARVSLEERVVEAGAFVTDFETRIEEDLETLTDAECEAEERIAELTCLVSDAAAYKKKLRKLRKVL